MKIEQPAEGRTKGAAWTKGAHQLLTAGRRRQAPASCTRSSGKSEDDAMKAILDAVKKDEEEVDCP